MMCSAKRSANTSRTIACKPVNQYPKVDNFFVKMTNNLPKSRRKETVMSVIIIVGIIWGICKLISAASAASKERARQAQLERIRREQERVKLEQARQREAWKSAQAAERERVRQMVALEREQARQAKEQERIAKEQERQAAQLAKHEEQLMKLNMRLSVAESEIAFNREQRERLFQLLDIEERERAACIEGSSTWQKHHKKVISLENQIHTVQKRIDKAQMDKTYCKSKLAS